MNAEVDELWREGMIAHLLSLHQAAWLTPGIPHIRDDATDDDIAELRRPGVELYQALFEPTRNVPWYCPIASRAAARGKGHSPRLLEVRNRRLATTRVARPEPRPSGWRPEQWLVADRPLLAHEGHDGFHIQCPHCGRVHLFEGRQLAKRVDDTYPETGPEQPSELPSGYPSIDDAAFVRIDGPYGEIETAPESLSEIVVSLPQHRQQLLDQYTKENPDSMLAYPALLSGPFVRVPDSSGSYRVQHGIHPHEPDRRVWDWPPPEEDGSRLP